MDHPLRLRNCHEALLNQFLHFDPMHLVVRSRGLSFVRETKFGVFTAQRRGDCRNIRDEDSGLALSPERLEAVYLFSRGSGRPPVFELEFTGYGFGISIQPRETPRSLDLLHRIASSFGDKTVSGPELVGRGAGSWLDEWGHIEEGGVEESNMGTVSGTVAEGRISAQIRNSAFEAGIVINPAFEDRDGHVRRIAAAGGCDAIVIDDNILVVRGDRGDQAGPAQLHKVSERLLHPGATTR